MNKVLDALAAWVMRGVDWRHFIDTYEEEGNRILASVARRIKRDPEFKHFCQELVKEYARWEKYEQQIPWETWIAQVIGWEEEAG